MMDCKEVLAALSDYLDDEATTQLRQAIEEHLARCSRCWIVYDTTWRTLAIVSDSLPVAVPMEVTSSLQERLRQIYTPNS